MSTEKPRICLTVPDEMDEVITKLAARMGTPKTTVIMSVLEAGLPSLKKTLFVMEKVQNSQEKGVLGAMASMMRDAGFDLPEKGAKK